MGNVLNNKKGLEKELKHISNKILENNLDAYFINEKIKQANYNILLNKYASKRRKINELKLKYNILAKEYNTKYGEKYTLYKISSIRPLKPKTKFYNKLTKKPLAIR